MEREISIVLKVKGAKASKKAVQDIFDNQTATLVKGFNKETKKATDNVGKLGRASKKTSKNMQSFTKVLGRGMAALYLYNRAWDTFGRNFKEGVQLERAGMIFESNVGNINRMLPELRSATRGVVDDLVLLRSANRAFQQGIQPQAMSRTFKMATIAAQKLGLNASDAINTITNAITKQDEGALNTLGIVTKVNQAYKTQVALIAKSGGVMSNAMSIQLRQSLIMKELESRFGRANKVQSDGLLILERFRASWKNFRAEIGQTIGIGLRPLIQVMTGVLDVTTSLLDKLNNTRGFQKFIQMATTLGIIFGTAKFISATKNLMGLFGFMGGAGSVKLPRMLRVTNVLMAKFGKWVISFTPKFGNFLKMVGRLAPRLSGLLRFIPGWGVALTALTLLFDPLVAVIKTAYTASKVFFQLLSNFDENSGMSKVLRKDKESLGSFYNFVENSTKIALQFWAVIKGVGQGVSDAFSPMVSLIGWAGDKLSQFTGWLFEVDRSATLATSSLDAVTASVRKLTKWIGLGVSMVAMFIPGLQGVGLLGGTVFGGSLLSDFMGSDTGQAIGNYLSGLMPSSQDSAVPVVPTPQATPDMGDTGVQIRPMNLDTTESQEEVNKRILKILEKQTNIMEVDSQKQDIRDSQNNARGNILNR